MAQAVRQRISFEAYVRIEAMSTIRHEWLRIDCAGRAARTRLRSANSASEGPPTGLFAALDLAPFLLLSRRVGHQGSTGGSTLTQSPGPPGCTDGSVRLYAASRYTTR